MVRANNDGDANIDPFAKTICSICFEDLKPLIDDLQVISVCGHVFHELCLQQWFEYCPNLKKRSCPICKQACNNKNVGRLYFQSVGDKNDCCSQKPCDNEETPEELRNEVNRLRGKVSAITSSLEQQQKEFTDIKDELRLCNDKLKKEVALKNEALIQTAASQQLLRVKSEELDRSTLECMRLKEKNLALAKELATYKLAYDMDLKEDEAMKLASLGNDTGSREGNHLLIKSLDTHKRSYKELLAKCNDLGRRETRYCEELENANKKIKKLKLRVRELATAAEIKENAALRVLKDQNIKPTKSSHEHQTKKSASLAGLDESKFTPDMPFCSGKDDLSKPMSGNEQVRGLSSTNEDNDLRGCSYKNSKSCAVDNIVVEERQDPRPFSCFNVENGVETVKSDNKDGESFSSSLNRKRDRADEVPSNVDDEVICLGNTNPVNTARHIGKETSSLGPVSQPGGQCFSGGLLGPDGTNWHLGKWCKKAQNQGSNARSGDLISVGADGRGGQIKVMRSLNQPSLDSNDTSWTKKCKQAKPSNLQGKGVLQIEHFFRRTAG